MKIMIEKKEIEKAYVTQIQLNIALKNNLSIKS